MVSYGRHLLQKSVVDVLTTEMDFEIDFDRLILTRTATTIDQITQMLQLRVPLLQASTEIFCDAILSVAFCFRHRLTLYRKQICRLFLRCYSALAVS